MRKVVTRFLEGFCVATAVLLPAIPGAALVEPARPPALAEKIFRHPGLDFPALYLAVDELPEAVAAEARERLAKLGVDEKSVRVDWRSGRFITLLPATPLIPGSGQGNDLAWEDPDSVTEEAVQAAFVKYLETYRQELGIDESELLAPRIASHDGFDLVQIFWQRGFDGIPIRGSFLTAVLGQGNLTLLGAERWGNRPAGGADAQLTAEEARRFAEDFLAPFRVAEEWAPAERVWLPMGSGKDGHEVDLGQGYAYRLAWSIKVNVADEAGGWELLVDAASGEILACEDQYVYAEARGGVYPVSNDGIDPDGREQPGWPLPFLALTGGTTDTGGNANVGGSITASLSGPYVQMADNCGPISLTQSGGLDFGTSSGTDCTTPGFGGAGNTHASRTGFYELNKIKEMARGQLPANGWLQQQLIANMNETWSACNAAWFPNDGTVHFLRSGSGCANSGEIAGIFDHEWGHGLDDNDVDGAIASPSGEGIADVYAALRLDSSCIGRNFTSTRCTGYGDPCLSCTGVRDIDYQKRQSGQPHTFTWSNSHCNNVHCRGAVYAEAVWSLWKRELAAAPFNLQPQTAHELATRLTFLAAGNTSSWFAGSPPNGGCAASSGYLNYLAADDDNGNLSDGTPHMTAIHAAFDDQEIACSTPAVKNSGCAFLPTQAPLVTVATGPNSAHLSWGAVAGATRYQVFRSEGIFACDFGKVKLGETAGTTWGDDHLQKGRRYSYVVIPLRGGNSCLGPASACVTLDGNQIFEQTDASGKLTIAVFERTSTVAAGHNTDFEIAVPPEYVVIGGGGQGKEAPDGNLLTASYPNAGLTAWLVSTKDHGVTDPVQVRGWAIGLKIAGLTPAQVRGNITVVQETSPTPVPHPDVTATLPSGYVLAGGGIKVTWSGDGNMATASAPSGPTSWRARSKDHSVTSHGTATAYAIGIKSSIPGVGTITNVVDSGTSATTDHPAFTQNLTSGHVLSGCGAFVNWSGHGNLLWRIEPSSPGAGQAACSVASKDHMFTSHASITGYSLGLQAH